MRQIFKETTVSAAAALILEGEEELTEGKNDLIEAVRAEIHRLLDRELQGHYFHGIFKIEEKLKIEGDRSKLTVVFNYKMPVGDTTYIRVDVEESSGKSVLDVRTKGKVKHSGQYSLSYTVEDMADAALRGFYSALSDPKGSHIGKLHRAFKEQWRDIRGMAKELSSYNLNDLVRTFPTEQDYLDTVGDRLKSVRSDLSDIATVYEKYSVERIDALKQLRKLV